MLQEKVQVQISESVKKLLMTNPDFYHRLRYCANWKKEDAKQFLNEAIFYVKTSTKLEIRGKYKYHFSNLIFSGSTGCPLIYKVYNSQQYYCAKIEVKGKIEKEYNMAVEVKGNCVMPVIEMLDMKEGRCALITPLYEQSISELVFGREDYLEEDIIIVTLLCGISAIYSFATKGLCHCDIKLENLMIEKPQKIVLIDFGSVTKFDDVIISTTPGYRFDFFSPSIRYDINSLSITIARMMLKKNENFPTKEYLLFVMNTLESKYPNVVKMLQMMKIDQDLNAQELLEIWKEIFNLAKSTLEFASECPAFSPPLFQI
jgi:serine/threonine protein kinase